MPPKGKRAAADKEKAKDVQETEEKLQAVVLTDSFETRFSPLTLERPRCLLPLVNAPLLEYTLQWLEYAGVQEVFVYPGNHADQVEDFINARTSDFSVEMLRSESRSIGDVMRDLDKRGVMTGDFLVVHGDVVSNVTIDDALAKHRERKAVDKSAIMTMLVMEAGSSQRATDRSRRAAFLIDPKNERILQYEQLTRHGEFYTDAEHYENHAVLNQRYDLIDCGIDICTADVLALWSDNFDYEFPRKNFLHSVLKDYELNGKTIHIHKVGKKYAAGAHNLQAYDSIARDILSGFTRPMHPDTGLLELDVTYRNHYNGGCLKADGAFIDRSAKVDSGSVVGHGSKIAQQCTITRTVIGRNCQIEPECILEDSHLADGCNIGRGTKITKSFLADNVAIGEDCTIFSDTILSYGVKVGDKTVIKERARITKAQEVGKDPKITNTAIAGEGGEGQEYIESEDEDEEVTGLSGRPYGAQDNSDSEDSVSTLNSEDDFSDAEPHTPRHRASDSFASATSDDSTHDAQTAKSFHLDASTSIYDSLQKGDDVSTIQLELQGLRMVANATDHQIRRAVVVGITKHIIASRQTGPSAKEIVKNSKQLMERTIHDKDDEKKEDQVDFLMLVQKEVSDKPDGDSVLLAMCNALYLEEVIEDEGLEQWWEGEQSTATEELRKVRGKTKQLMDALAEDDDEDDGSEESE